MAPGGDSAGAVVFRACQGPSSYAAAAGHTPLVARQRAERNKGPMTRPWPVPAPEGHDSLVAGQGRNLKTPNRVLVLLHTTGPLDDDRFRTRWVAAMCTTDGRCRPLRPRTP